MRPFRDGDEAGALAFLETMPGLYVVKTDGLAEGKGVFVTESLSDARDAVRAYLCGAAFGDAGRTLVIEEGLTGPELSLLAVCNGDPSGARPLAPAQDFKRIGEGDTGLNTGGMGAYSPVPIAAGRIDELMDHVHHAHPGAPRGRRHRLPRRALRRLDVHARRPEARRVQRAIRRSRGAGGAAAVAHRPG